MTVSGTVSSTSYDVADIIEDALRLCQLPGELQTAEHFSVAKRALSRWLSTLPSNGLQLWTMEKLIFGLAEGQYQLVLPLGTVDVDKALVRTSTMATGSDTSTTASFVRDFGASNDQAVVSVGFTSASDQTLSLVVSTSDDGVTYAQAGAQTVVCLAGGIYGVDLTTVNPHRYLKVTEASGAVLNFVSGSVLTPTNPYEVDLYRCAQDEYVELPQKSVKGQPLEFWLDRQRDQPVMNIWNAADAATAATRQIIVWRKRYIMDVGDYMDTLDIPQSWHQAIIDNLAYQCCRLLKECDKTQLPNLKTEADGSLRLAQNENRDSSPLDLMPDLSPYTR